VILVISDMHFGVEPSSDARETTVGMQRLLSFIEEKKPEKIILLGDVFDFYRCDVVDAIESGRSKFFSRLDEIINQFPCSIVYIVGNHDHFFRQKEYIDGTMQRIEGGRNAGEIDENLVSQRLVPSARDVMRILLPHAHKIVAEYPFHLETISGKTFFFEHGDYTDYLFFYGGGWERYLSPFLKREEAKSDLPHALEYLESLASIRNTASYYQKIEEHLHTTLESIQRNITVNETRRTGARVVLAFLFLLFFIATPLFLWAFGIEDIFLFGYFVLLGSLFFSYFLFKERLLQKTVGLFLRIFLDAFGPSRGERVEELVSGRLSSKMFGSAERKSYLDLLEVRAGCKVDYFVFGHTHAAGGTHYHDMVVLNTGCWCVNNSLKANRLVDNIGKVKNREGREQRLYSMAERVGDKEQVRTLLIIEKDEVSLISLPQRNRIFSQPF
jgi:UDP-2,3-diacylglucosamine pyrophosphatase LpxH